jgi:hypothetical protein
MNKTLKDFEKEINRIKQIYTEDQLKYNLPFKFEQSDTHYSYTFIISNNKISTIITLDKTLGYLTNTNITRHNLEKCLQMQKEVEEGHL